MEIVMIEIMNLRNTKPSLPYDFKVDRTTPLGNKFVMHKESDRNLVCDQYDEHFSDLLESERPMKYFMQIYTAYKEHRTVRLFCWCAPKRCHAETIKKVLDNIKKALEEIK